MEFIAPLPMEFIVPLRLVRSERLLSVDSFRESFLVLAGIDTGLWLTREHENYPCPSFPQAVSGNPDTVPRLIGGTIIQKYWMPN